MKKPNGTGTIYLRGNLWWVKLYINNRAHYESSKSTKLSDAKRLLNRLIAQKVRGEITGGRPDRVLISELLDDVLLSEIAPSTRKVWQQVVKANLLPFFGQMKASRLGTSQLEEYRAKRKAEGRTDSTVNRELTILRTAFNSGRKQTPPKVLWTPHFTMRSEADNVRTGFLPDSVYPILRDAITEPEVRLAFVVAYSTGARKGELLAVKWDQVDLRDGFISLTPNTTKNGEGRDVPIIAGDMMDLLKEAKQFRDENFPRCQWVFHRSGKQVRDFRTVWLRATKVAGVPDLLFHDLRRTAVRNMRRHGVPQSMRRKISGHKTASMEERYNIVDRTDLVIAKRLMEGRQSEIVTES
jgi:integrase